MDRRDRLGNIGATWINYEHRCEGVDWINLAEDRI
jgi:hypothetical protein